MALPNIDVTNDRIADFCRRHHIRKLAFFGSVLRPDFRPESDIDVLVEFEPGHVPGLAFIRLQDELSEILNGRTVDLVTAKFLHPLIREDVLAHADWRYVQE
jgi:hypothetical protein